MTPIHTMNRGALTVGKKTSIVIALVLQGAAVVFLCFTGRASVVFLILVIAIVMFFTLFSVRRLLLLFVAYVSLLPVYPEQHVSMSLKLSFSFPIAAVLLLLILTFWLIDRLMEGKFSIKFTRIDRAVFVFLLLVGFSASLGYARSHQNWYILKDVFFLSLYLLYFAVVYGVDEEWVHRFFKVFVVISLMVSLVFLIIAMPHYRTAFALFRLVTQQPRLALLSIPYLLATILNSSSRKEKLIALFPILCLTAMVLISLTRGVWLGLLASLLTLFAFHVFSSGVSRRTFLKFVILVVLIPGLILSSFVIIQKIIGGSSGFSIVIRLFSLKNPLVDPALTVRMIDYTSVMKKMGGNILWGRGLGDITSNIAIKRPHSIVDNSYIYLFWKMGIIGLVSYLIMLLFLFQRCVYVLRNSLANKRRRVIVLSTISCFVGLMVTAMADTALTSYSYVAIWAILIGSIELLARNISAERGKILSTIST